MNMHKGGNTDIRITWHNIYVNSTQHKNKTLKLKLGFHCIKIISYKIETYAERDKGQPLKLCAINQIYRLIYLWNYMLNQI